MIRRLGLTILICLAGILPAIAAEPGNELDAALKRDGQMVFLPMSEYDQLLKTPATPPQHLVAPFYWVFGEARYSVAARGDLALVKANYTVDILDDGEFAIPIVTGDLALESATLDGKDVLLVPLTDGAENGVEARFAVVAKGKGSHALVINFSVPVKDFDARVDGVWGRRIAFGVPRTSITSVELKLDRKDARPRPGSGQTLAAGGNLVLEPTAQLTLEWLQNSASPVPAVVADTTPAETTGEVESVYRVDGTALTVDSHLTFRVRKGQASELKVLVPKGCRLVLLRETGDRIPEWREEPTAKGTLIHIRRNPPATSEPDKRDQEFNLVMESDTPVGLKPSPVPVSSPSPKPSVHPSATPASPHASGSPTPGPSAQPPAPDTTGTAPVMLPAPPANKARPDFSRVAPGRLVPTEITVEASADTHLAPSPHIESPDSILPFPVSSAPVQLTLPPINLPEVKQQTTRLALVSDTFDQVNSAEWPNLPGMPAPVAFPPGAHVYGAPGTNYRWIAVLKQHPPLAVLSVPCRGRGLKVRTWITAEGGVATQLDCDISNDGGSPTLEVWIPSGGRFLSGYLDKDPIPVGQGEIREPGRMPDEEAGSLYQVLHLPLQVSPDGSPRWFHLSLTYQQHLDPLSLQGQFVLDLPRLRLQVDRLQWDVSLPHGYAGAISSSGLYDFDVREDRTDTPEAAPSVAPAPHSAPPSPAEMIPTTSVGPDWSMSTTRTTSGPELGVGTASVGAGSTGGGTVLPLSQPPEQRVQPTTKGSHPDRGTELKSFNLRDAGGEKRPTLPQGTIPITGPLVGPGGSLPRSSSSARTDVTSAAATAKESVAPRESAPVPGTIRLDIPTEGGGDYAGATSFHFKLDGPPMDGVYKIQVYYMAAEGHRALENLVYLLALMVCILLVWSKTSQAWAGWGGALLAVTALICTYFHVAVIPQMIAGAASAGVFWLIWLFIKHPAEREHR